MQWEEAPFDLFVSVGSRYRLSTALVRAAADMAPPACKKHACMTAWPMRTAARCCARPPTHPPTAAARQAYLERIVPELVVRASPQLRLVTEECDARRCSLSSCRRVYLHARVCACACARQLQTPPIAPSTLDASPSCTPFSPFLTHTASSLGVQRVHVPTANPAPLPAQALAWLPARHCVVSRRASGSRRWCTWKQQPRDLRRRRRCCGCRCTATL
jgi:hypothetical protein